ncbi:MAG TPA: LysR substrate-binding domain-containing protein [Burkholderiaceae bacterium]|nr:LysR substrate-binding domain-containing protein [Burkholderiaceae bacterium]
MNSTPPDLGQVRLLLAVADAPGFRRAALQLGLSPSALSQAIKRLEARLGQPLLLRSTRSVRLTEAGERLCAAARDALAQLDRAWQDLTPTALGPAGLQGRLRLSVPRSVARLVMAPLLAAYCRRHPGVQLELCTDDALVDIVAGGFDAGVRFSERLPRGMVALPLSPPQRFVVVGRPELIATAALPSQPQDLARWPGIRQRFASGALFEWEFRQDGETRYFTPAGPLTVDDQAVALAAAMEGAGLAYVYEQLASEALAQGRLQCLLPAWCPPGTGVELYYPGRRQASPALRALIELVRERVPRS